MDIYSLFTACILCSMVSVSSAIRQNYDESKCSIGDLDDISSRHCDGYAIRCNGTELQEVPSHFPTKNSTRVLCLLDLSNNSITSIRSHDFKNNIFKQLKMLNLSKNKLISVEDGAFDSLTSLTYLNMSTNNLTMPDNIGLHVLTNLQSINLNENRFLTFDGLGEKFKFAKNLTGLFIDGCMNCKFGPSFANLTKLVNVSLSGHFMDSCNWPSVGNYTFEYVPNIKHLWMSNCNIINISENAFSNLTSLELLDISYNEKLEFRGLNIALYGLRNSTSLVVLNVNRIHHLYERGTTLKVKHMYNLKTIRNLKFLYMDLNKLEVIEEDVINGTYFPESLINLTLSGNRLVYGKYLGLIHLLKIVHLDISRQHLFYDPYSNQHHAPEEWSQDSLQPLYTTYSDTPVEHTEIRLNGPKGLKLEATKLNNTPRKAPNLTDTTNTELKLMALEDTVGYTRKNLNNVHSLTFHGYDYKCTCNASTNINCTILELPQRLKTFEIHKSAIYLPTIMRTIICPLNKLKTLDLSVNFISNWQGPIFGLETMTHLDLSRNYANNMSVEFLWKFKSIQYLNISGNFLGRTFSKKTPRSKLIFKNLSELKVLDMSKSELRNIPRDIFNPLKSLKDIRLSDNFIDDCNISFVNNHFLKYLDLSKNQIRALSQRFLDDLESKTNSAYTTTNDSNLYVNLASNPIDCNCGNTAFFKAMRKSKVTFLFHEDDHCTKDGSQYNIRNVDEIMRMLESDCRDWVWLKITASTLLTCFISVVLSVLIYRYRWKLRYRYRSRYRRRTQHGFERLFDNDAFVSYANANAVFIKNKLYPELVDRRSLSLWVADKHSIPGGFYADNVSHAIYSSRKSVLLIDKNYLREDWCDYEMNMARMESIETKRKMLIIVFMEPKLSKELPLALRRLLDNEISLTYPEHPQDLDTFWETLADYITSD